MTKKNSAFLNCEYKLLGDYVGDVILVIAYQESWSFLMYSKDQKMGTMNPDIILGERINDFRFVLDVEYLSLNITTDQGTNPSFYGKTGTVVFNNEEFSLDSNWKLTHKTMGWEDIMHWMQAQNEKNSKLIISITK